MQRIVAIAPEYPAFPALHALLADVYATSDHMSDDFSTRFPDPETLAREFADIARRPGGLVLVAGTPDRPDGYLSVEPRPQVRLRHTADLSMGVRAAARGRGVGRALLDTALARLAADGIVEIVYLMVRADHAAALRLYSSVGFERLATLDRDTRIGDRYYDGVLMRRFVGGASAKPLSRESPQ